MTTSSSDETTFSVDQWGQVNAVLPNEIRILAQSTVKAHLLLAILTAIKAMKR